MTEPDMEYTRFKSKLQIGDGVDARSETTVEVVREIDEDRDPTRSVTLDDGTEVPFATNDAAFAEFALELDRAVAAVRDELDLDDG